MAMDSLALHELNSKSAGIGAWMVKVHGMQYIEYEYTWNQKPQKGQKLECFLVASDGTYCQGTIKSLSRSRLGNGGSDPVAELRQMMKKFADGTIWKMTKVSLANEKVEYIGSPVKICIDLRKTVCTGILQTLVKMPVGPALEESLESILTLPSKQKVDLTALISDMSLVRRETTLYGVKDMTDITPVDGSKVKDTEAQVKAKVSLFFDASEQGAALLKSMQQARDANTPVAFFGLTCIPGTDGKCEFKTGQSFFWETARGSYTKLEHLLKESSELLAAPANLITKEWQPSQANAARDFAGEPAVHSVCGWVAALLRPAQVGGAQEPAEEEPQGTDEVFQINHCHVAVPAPGDELLTKDGDRIWLRNVRIMDATGSLTVAVREKAALALAGLESRDAFQEAHASDNVSFPVLASVRLHLSKRKDSGESQNPQGGATGLLTAVMVEAQDQDIEQMPTKALLELQPILKSLALSTEELKICCLKDISVMPHVGMVVGGMKCGLAVALIGATVKSEFLPFGEGFRLITKNVLDVGFGATAMKPGESRGGGAKEPTGMDLVAICTANNLTEYKMAPPRKTDVQYALVVLSSVHEIKTTNGAEESVRKEFMIERLQPIQGIDNAVACQKMLGKLNYARAEFTFEGTKRDRSAWSDTFLTPVSSAKRVRRLSQTPTGGSLPDDSRDAAKDRAD